MIRKICYYLDRHVIELTRAQATAILIVFGVMIILVITWGMR